MKEYEIWNFNQSPINNSLDLCFPSLLIKVKKKTKKKTQGQLETKYKCIQRCWLKLSTDAGMNAENSNSELHLGVVLHTMFLERQVNSNYLFCTRVFICRLLVCLCPQTNPYIWNNPQRSRPLPSFSFSTSLHSLILFPSHSLFPYRVCLLIPFPLLPLCLLSMDSKVQCLRSSECQTVSELSCHWARSLHGETQINTLSLVLTFTEHACHEFKSEVIQCCSRCLYRFDEGSRIFVYVGLEGKWNGYLIMFFC